MPHLSICRLLAALLVSLLLLPLVAEAQGTSFTYQGKLSDGGAPANGSYDFQFKLFDSTDLTISNQVGSTITKSAVVVANGIFTVELDFGACPACFDGAARYLEIAVRPTSSGTFTTLGPRQPLSSTPYAIRSLNAAVADGLSVACVNCITSGQIASVQGSQVTGTIAGSQISGTIPVASVPAGSADYIQNTTSQQAASNFNISGSGTAAGTLSGSIVNAATQYNLGGQRLLSTAGTENMFAGIFAGTNTTGNGNAFFGTQAGFWNTTGNGNAFFGRLSGYSNTTSTGNAFFGNLAGYWNTTGNYNAFFGNLAGKVNTTGGDNAFFGSFAGQANTTGSFNAFFGDGAGSGNTIGNYNAFFGEGAGYNNTTGLANTFIGGGANFNSYSLDGNYNTLLGYQTKVYAGVSNGTAIGAWAYVTQSNSLVLGAISGVNGATADTNVGIGTSAPSYKLHVVDPANQGLRVQTNAAGGTVASFGGQGAFQIDAAGIVGGRLIITEAGNVGINTNNPLNKLDVAGIIAVGSLGTGGATPLCRNASLQISTCASSLRYKSDVRPFSAGLDILNRLRPISFTWKQGGTRDLGLAAEEVEKVEPLLVTHNDKGEVEGVKYDRINLLLINAVKQQQAQIEALKKLVCLDHPTADVCK